MRLHIPLLLLILAGGTLALGSTRTPDESEAPALEAPRPTKQPLLAWKDIAARPGHFLGQRIRLRLQFHSHVKDWNPYLTRFGTGHYIAIQGWTDEQFPWIESDYEQPAVRVFARSDTSAARELLRGEAYGRFEVQGIVRETFLGLPWIEIDSAFSIAEHITEATAIHAARAIELMKEEAWRLAELELEQALAAPLPDTALFELERLRQACQDHVPPAERRRPGG
jgi:hypothetical protein